MCRLYGFLASEPTKVECTLVQAQNALLHQSDSDLRGKSHPDGWGICWYANGQATCEKRTTAAHQDLWFAETAERIFAKAVIAHVRRATVGETSQTNTHPFALDRWTFAHNGTIADFPRIESRMRSRIDPDLLDQRRGQTDSEMYFAWLATAMRRRIGPPTLFGDYSGLVEPLQEAVADLVGLDAETQDSEVSQLNFVLSDGQALLALRWNHTLHYVERDGVHDCEICGIPHVRHHEGTPYRAVVVASEPISHESWVALPNHSLLLVDPSLRVSLFPMEEP